MAKKSVGISLVSLFLVFVGLLWLSPVVLLALRGLFFQSSVPERITCLYGLFSLAGGVGLLAARPWSRRLSLGLCQLNVFVALMVAGLMMVFDPGPKSGFWGSAFGPLLFLWLLPNVLCCWYLMLYKTHQRFENHFTLKQEEYGQTWVVNRRRFPDIFLFLPVYAIFLAVTFLAILAELLSQQWAAGIKAGLAAPQIFWQGGIVVWWAVVSMMTLFIWIVAALSLIQLRNWARLVFVFLFFALMMFGLVSPGLVQSKALIVYWTFFIVPAFLSMLVFASPYFRKLCVKK